MVCLQVGRETLNLPASPWFSDSGRVQAGGWGQSEAGSWDSSGWVGVGRGWSELEGRIRVGARPQLVVSPGARPRGG